MPDIILGKFFKLKQGRDDIKSRYVAMTVALALFTRDYAHLPDALDQNTRRVNSVYLKECYSLACGVMKGDNLEKRVRLYVECTQKDMLPGINLVILDIDNTLVKPIRPDFYRKYSEAVNAATADYLGVSLEEGTRVADFYRQNFGGGEMALFSGTIGQFFPEYGEKQPDFELLYDAMCSIDPAGQFKADGISAALIRLLRTQGKKVVAITDSPKDLSRRILKCAGIDPDQDFDLYLAYTKEEGPPKILQKEKIFAQIANSFKIPPDRTLSVGDNYKSDIQPAEQLGMKTCLVSPQLRGDYSGLQARSFDTVFETYRNSL